MAEDLVKGLDSFYEPKFSQLSVRIDRLDKLVENLTHAVAQKEQRSEVEKLRENMEYQFSHENGTIKSLEDRMVEYNSRRCYEIRELTDAVRARSTAAETGRLAVRDEQLEALQAALTKRLDGLAADVAARATCGRMAAQLEGLAETVRRKAGVEAVGACEGRLEALAGEVALKATQARAEELGRELQALSGRSALKAEGAEMARLGGLLEKLGADVEQKATITEVGRLICQLSALDQRVHVEEMKMQQVAGELQGNSEKLHMWWTRAAAYQSLPQSA
eukprot:CAMPEP_0179243858 /NCGR_PEP_ID=MMETSP0797-20121207/17760_1 /TAXON_ID=47934 /ORGANISM="Dinophysis acuminata, Strain DAEP01" /LENGTH=277 /DNA_ID=CAMNT_0020951359 /DNA_START=45 /DNA_END=875 /DNA_ORIENTATION=-